MAGYESKHSKDKTARMGKYAKVDPVLPEEEFEEAIEEVSAPAEEALLVDEPTLVSEIIANPEPVAKEPVTEAVPEIAELPSYPGQAEPTIFMPEVEEADHKKWPIILVAVLIGLMVLAAGLFAFYQAGFFNALLGIKEPVSEEVSSVVEVSSAPEVSEVERAPVTEIMPEQMRGAYVLPGVDYMANDENTPDTVKEEIDAAMKQLSEYTFNTVFIPVNNNGEALYKSKLFSASPLAIENYDVLAYLIIAAKENGLSPYAVIDCGITEGLVEPTEKTTMALLKGEMRTLGSYEFDGYVLDGYAYEKDSELLLKEMEKIEDKKEKTAFAEKTITDAVTSLYSEICDTNKLAVCGIITEPVWATAGAREGGIEVEDDPSRSMLLDGHADAKTWISKNLIDFVVVNDNMPLDDENLGFKAVAEWWGNLCNESEVLFFTSHAAYKMNKDGWKSPDELALQWAACNDIGNWRGGVFYGLSDLKKDWKDSTKVLLETMEGSMNLEDLAHKLTMTSPKTTDTTTDESHYVFEGTADPHFPLTMDNKKVEMTEHGLFAEDVKLNPGRNTFVFEHKGTKVTYTINYIPELVKSVSPSQSLTLPGETAISISAICYKDASVYATIDGKKVSMKEAPIKKDENDGEDSTDYINFSGEYTLPAATAKEQNLGAITVHVSYGGESRTVQGGHLYVEAEEIIETTTTEEITTTEETTTETTTLTTTTKATTKKTTAGSSVSGGTTKKTTKATTKATTKKTTAKKTTTTTKSSAKVLATGKIMKITSAYAETFDNNVNDYSSPKRNHYPAGTLDVLKKTVYDSASGNTYYLLGSGRRVYKGSAAVYQTSGNLTENKISGISSSVGGTYTTLTLSSSWAVPYTLEFLPQSYPYEGKMGTFGPLYDISSFTATYIDITFHYTTAGSGSFNLSSSPVLSNASWIKNSNNTYTLRLTMKKTGYFSGYTATWNGNNLVFQFRHAVKASTNTKKPLTGMTIMVDPGHGGPYPGTYGVIKGLYEKTLTLQYGLTLKSKLESLGATVIMTRSTDVFYELEELQAMARAKQPDLYISVHMDGVDAASANGPSVHYYNEWSKELAKDVYTKIKATYDKHKTTTYRGNLGGGTWDPFAVTRISDCPSILIECGFMTNKDDEDLLITDSFRSEFCNSVAQGVAAYQKTVAR